MAKSSSHELFLVLGNQLFDAAEYEAAGARRIFMAEDLGLCTHFKYHKIKLIFFLTAMRDFRDGLDQRKFDVHYISATHSLFSKSYEEKLRDYLKSHPEISSIKSFEVEDVFFEKRLIDFCKQENLDLQFLKSPMFYCTREDFKNYLQKKKTPFMKTFYENQRKKFSILLDKNKKPLGGQWSFDKDNRNKLDKDKNPPPLPHLEVSKNFNEVKKVVLKNFSDHPGEVDHFWVPTDRKGAQIFLESFIADRLRDFGAYQDSITQKSDFVYHSTISPMINVGLLTPKEVVDSVLDAFSDGRRNLPINSVEGFIRQVLGWREFVRGVYQNFHELEETKNFFGHHRKMKSCWYEGTTQIPILDDAIKKANKYAYNHHIERLMILSNLMLLCELDPRVVHQWFMEMYVDSSDWVMGPNVYGMGQFSDGGLFATKPYTCGSNYYLKMSDYKKGDWCDIVDGLYWRFIDKNQDFYKSNPRMGFMVGTLSRMDPSRKSVIFKAAESFIERTTEA